MSINDYFTTTFNITRPVWTTDDDDNAFAENSAVVSFLGQLQQAQPDLIQSLGLSFTKAFAIWCAVDTDVKEGDTLEVVEGETTTKYSVKAVMRNNIGQNKHLELVVQLDEVVPPDPIITAPVVSTSSASAGHTNATLNGDLTDDGGEECEVGFVYGLTSVPEPDVPETSGYDTLINHVSTITEAQFTDPASPLIGLTLYYYRAWARNSAGYTYGEEVQFTTTASLGGGGGGGDSG